MVDHLKQTDINTRRIQAVEEAFGSSGVPLQHANRVLIGDGVLIKMCRKKAKPRQFFLFNDILVYGTILSRRKFTKQRIIPLEEVRIENVEDEGESENLFLVKTRTKSFVLHATTKKEKEQWMDHIEKCVSIVLKEGKEPAHKHAAVWVPDSQAEVCMVCQSTHFTVFERRHHCRSCGKVVCGACSTKKLTLEGIDKKPVRVCDICYNKLFQNCKVSPQAQNDSDDDTEHQSDEFTTFYDEKEEGPGRLV
ncbi:unnamed protein product [Bursaphelenchus xylophilus]|uniref:(pine wood nematode) hypothetical protein n=1 Tax=Bursaphelenchus xylophilus TaxID=6326 RepID=A0A1I7SAX0_BURXY|nr:unnamed protein product [Bursaphelenchus xylophilus]CAG9106130.1 unnamed protein product [Bursaphelenchus xylophilus]